MYERRIEAVGAYDKYALERHGEYAYTNKMIGLL